MEEVEILLELEFELDEVEILLLELELELLLELELELLLELVLEALLELRLEALLELRLELLLLELLELELTELLELDSLELTELALLDDKLELLTLELLELDELLELLRSSIDKIRKRSPENGPGNCNEPVWKFKTSLVLISPDVLVSINTACQIVLSANSTTTLSTAAPASASWVAVTAESSPAFIIRVIVNTRVARPTA